MPVSVPDTIPDTTPEQQTEPTPETLQPTAAQGIDLSQTQGEIDLAQTDLKQGVIFDENAKGIFNNLGEAFGIKNLGESLKNLTEGSILLTSCCSLFAHFLGGTFEKRKPNSDNKDTTTTNPELTKKINEIKQSYEQQIQNETTPEGKKQKTEEMYQKILEEMVKTPKFEDIVNTKIEQAIALHKIDNPNDKNREPTTDEKTKIITDTFDELTTGKDKNSKEYIGIQIEKIGYLCKNDENLDISNLLTNEFEEIKNIKDNLIKINETNNNFDEIQQKLTKIKTIRTILIEKGLGEKMNEGLEINLKREQLQKITDEIFTFETNLCEKYKENQPRDDTKKKEIITECYTTLKNEINNISGISNDEKITVETIINDYMYERGCGEILNLTPSENDTPKIIKYLKGSNDNE